MRKVIAIALALAVQAAALRAPLVHAHPDDHDTDHHGAGTVHAHFSGHAHSHHSSESDGPELEAADHDRAVYLNAFVAVAAASISADALTHVRFELPVPAERAAHRVVEIVRSHDPPVIRSRSSRAPPALPVLL